MIKYITILLLATAVLLASWDYGDNRPLSIDEDDTVAKVLEMLGEDMSSKKPSKAIEGVSATAGEQLFKYGFADKVKGGKTRQQSKHFVCTSCHNVEKEDPNLTVSDPQARLEYTAKRNMPFLQGTTMYGAINRETYYNGDYEKKYGKLVEEARHDVRGAIQLCAVECAQGRALKDWELESMVAYLWSIGLKVEDLNMTEEEIKNINSGNIADADKMADIKSKYLLGSPAHFALPPVDRKVGTGLQGDSANGKLVYENSCLHCHYKAKYSFFHLDNSRLSFKHLRKKAPTYHNHSLYQVTRWGVPSKSGKRSYMPHYPIEKLSDQQLTDLMTYIEEQAG